MKILIVGASGTIGNAVLKELQADAEVLTAGSKSGDYNFDMTNNNSVTELFKQTGKLDAIISTAASGLIWKPVPEMTISDYVNSMQSKLLGQLNLALQGISNLNDHGSITLTTGILDHDFAAGASAAAMINGAINSFVAAAALELPKNIRINAISPALIAECAETYKDIFPGFEPVNSSKVARAYRKSVYGIQTGRVYNVS